MAAESSKPAGGAAIGEVIGATAGALIATTILFTLIYRHRTGKTQLLEKLAAASERITGMPGWASLPSVVGTSSLLVALLGMYWDIALHINVGRDEGPLANPAHYLILVGLFGIFAAGCIAVGLPKGEKPTPVRRPHHRGLVRARGRDPDRARRRLRAARVPARRHVAPALRPGRHALGPDPPHADRRRRHDADRPGDPPARGAPGEGRAANGAGQRSTALRALRDARSAACPRWAAS